MVNPRFCYCGMLGKINTSWTDSNPGRRFIGCERYGGKNACGYFVWVDPPMCERSKAVIPGLIRSLARHEVVMKKEKKKVMALWVALIVSWVFFISAFVLTWAY